MLFERSQPKGHAVSLVSERKEVKMNYSHIVWDFNGTILDDLWAGIMSENVLLRRRGMPEFKILQQYYDVFCFPIKKYYENLGYDFTNECYEDVADEWMKEYTCFSAFSPLKAGVREAVGHFKTLGLSQTIISMSEVEIMKRQIASFEITSYFDEILGLDNNLAHSKLELAREWKDRIKPRKALMLGDTMHDIETAKVLDADCILIAGGHQSKECLMQCGVPVIDSAAQLLLLS